MSEMKSRTNVNDFIGELNAGTFVNQLGDVLSAAALATVLNGQGNKKGKVGVEFTFQQIGENDQVVVMAKLTSSLPTKRGKKSEENTTDTPMFVGKGGVLTIDVPKEDESGQFNMEQEVINRETGEIINSNVRRLAN